MLLLLEQSLDTWLSLGSYELTFRHPTQSLKAEVIL